MFAIAICALNTSVDAETPELARDLACAAYDARLKLSQPPPSIVLRTNDAAQARAVGAAIRSRGHDVVAIDESKVPEATAVRALRFGDAFEIGNDAIAYADVVALVRAARALKTETIERVTERKLRPGAALATGGLVMSKKVTREEKHVAHDREELLYVFTRAERPRAPLLVAERSASYAALDSVASSQRENFLRVVQALRARAPRAKFDERLLLQKNLDSLDEITLRAQILAISLSRT